MIDYPANFPQPGTSFSGDVQTPTIRTDLATGLIEQEGRFSTGLENFRAQWTLSEAELATFEEWFAEDLAGGVLVFGLLLPDEGAYSLQPVRFVGGNYEVSHKGGLWWNVNATLELLALHNAPSNRTPSIPQWLRLAVDPAASQVLTRSHRNALLTVRPGAGSTTTLRILPPTSQAAYIYFGIDNQGDGETLITSQDVAPVIPEAIPSFPLDLPNINVAFNIRAERRAIRAEMDSGHPRQFSASKSTRKTYQVSWEFSLAELQSFQDFFFVTLKSGAGTFYLTLPVDGQFIPVPVRFVGGKYSESYVATDRFKVSATAERIVAQTVTPSTENPYPLFYSPTVNVTGNRKIYLSDAGKFFIVNPAEGETIYLYISTRRIEFGLLNKGLGNVQITRQPYPLAIGEAGTDAMGTLMNPAVFSLVDTIKNIGSIAPDAFGTSFNLPVFGMVSLLEDVGAIPPEGFGTTFPPAPMELLAVLEDIGTITPDTFGTTYKNAAFTLDIP